MKFKPILAPHRTLRAQMMVAFLTVFLIALGLLALLYDHTTRTALTGEANQKLYAAASRTAASLDAFIKANMNAVRTEATLPEIVAYLSLPAVQRAGSPAEAKATETLEALMNKDLFHIVSYALLDQQGRNLLDTSQPDVGRDESERDYFQVPLRTGLPYMSPVEFAQRVGGVYFYFSSPVRREGGQIVGVLRVRYGVAVLQNLVFESRGLAGSGSFAVLLDEYFLRLAHEMPELIFKTVVPLAPARVAKLRAAGRLPNRPIGELSTNLPELERGLRNAAQQPFFVADAHGGDTNLEQMAAVKLERQPWYVLFVQPRETFLAPIRGAIRATLVGGVIISILVAALVVILTQRLTRPIAHLTAAAERITAGDLSAQAPVESRDEIGRLARTFNSMTARLRETLEGLEQRNRRLNQEIAERKDAEKALRQYAAELRARNEELDAFAHTVAHDLKNPISIILGLGELLALDYETLSEEERVRCLRSIVRNARKLETIIDELLLLAGVRQMEVESEPLDMAPLVAEAQGRLDNLIEQQQAEIVVPESWPTALGYGPWIEEVWFNYLSNALKYGGQPPRVELGATINEETNGVVRFWVRDNGPGLTPEDQTRLFIPFKQLQAGGSRGHGLGLSIVRRIMEKLGGRAGVESQSGQGCEFYFTLPRAPSPPNQD